MEITLQNIQTMLGKLKTNYESIVLAHLHSLNCANSNSNPLIFSNFHNTSSVRKYAVQQWLYISQIFSFQKNFKIHQRTTTSIVHLMFGIAIFIKYSHYLKILQITVFYICIWVLGQRVKWSRSVSHQIFIYIALITKFKIT